MENEIENLAHTMAYKACEGKDIQTTAEGKSILKAEYMLAKMRIEEVVKSCLERV